MMEQTYTSEGHGYAILIACVNNMVIAYTTSCLGNIFHSALMGTLNVVPKGEEGIAAQCHVGVLCYPLFLLFQGEHIRLTGEEQLPGTVAQYVVVLVLRDVNVDSVVAVGAAYALLKRQTEHLRVLSQPPNEV